MKITEDHQNKLESLLIERAEFCGFKSLKDYVNQFKKDVESGKIKIIKCPATRCFWDITNKSALKFVCDEIYKYANDSHITTFYKKLYKKYQ